jgi:hypothetical protein
MTLVIFSPSLISLFYLIFFLIIIILECSPESIWHKTLRETYPKLQEFIFMTWLVA